MVRTSYSQSSTYIKCPMHWKWKYVDKYEPVNTGSSLYFGSAVDEAVMAMLEGSANFLTVFSDRWFSTQKRTGGSKKKEYYQIFDSPDLIFSYNDFDEHVLHSEDLESMKGWLEELKVGQDQNPVTFTKKVISDKKSKFKSPTNNELRYFNRCCWLSLKRKGELLIDLFHREFYPKIKKVVATQKFEFLKDHITGDTLMGALDFVAEYEGYDKPIVFDLKTSSRFYSEEQIELSEQLPLYLALSQGKYETNLVGYVVLIKNLKKEDEGVCKECGNIKTGRHKTCDAKLSSGVRCGGEWELKTKVIPQLQVIVREKSQEDVDKVLLDQGQILAAMRNNIVFRNLDNCSNWFGNKCPYYGACHKGSLEGLRKKY